MSITTPDDRVTTYAPVVPTTIFAADFPVFDNSDLTVIHNGVERNDFTVQASYVASISNDARVIFSPGITGSVHVVGARKPRRSSRFGSGPINANLLNAAFDTSQAEIQEARRDIDANEKSVENLTNLHSDLISQGNLPIYSTSVGMGAINVPQGMLTIRVNGTSTPGDGLGGLYVRVPSEPTTGVKFRSGDRYLPSGTTDMTNGGWWKLAPENLAGSIYNAKEGWSPTSPALRLRQELWMFENNVKGDEPDSDTPKMNEILDTARSWKVKARFEAKTYQTDAPLNVTGLSVEGEPSGFLNAIGTVIEASGQYPVIDQVTADANETNMNISCLALKGGSVGMRLRYVVNSHFSRIAVTDCVNGVQFGNANDVGGVFNKFSQIWTDVLDVGFALNGNSFANANEVELSYLKGGQYGATIDLVGGIGAVSNKFRVTEFIGPRYGVGLIGSNKGTDFDTCYFESYGPSILLDAPSLSMTVRNSTFAVLENTNPTLRNAFIYQNLEAGFCEINVEGGYIYLAAMPVHNGLYFVASDQPSERDLYMARPPSVRDVFASGFTLYN